MRWAMVAGLLALGCVDSHPTPDGDEDLIPEAPSETGCTPGETYECLCPGGEGSIAVCDDEGASGPCEACPEVDVPPLGGPPSDDDDPPDDPWEPEEPPPPPPPTCDATVDSLGIEIVDAEYSRPLERLVFVSEHPSRLHVFDARSGDDRVVELPAVPFAVSVSPDGGTAAVAHDGRVSHVDLVAGEVLATWDVPVVPYDVVLAGNGHAYVTAAEGQWTQLHSVDVAQGTVNADMAGLIYEDMVIKLHPGGTALYGTDGLGIGPGDLYRFDAGSGPATLVAESPYHGDHAMCGDLWMAEDGARMFTRCGSIFRASDVPDDDMLYGGSLLRSDSLWIRHLDHDAARGEVAFVKAQSSYGFEGGSVDDEAFVYFHDDGSLDEKARLRLPCFGAGRPHRGIGRFVFARGDGEGYHVLVQADAEAGLVGGFAVYELAP